MPTLTIFWLEFLKDFVQFVKLMSDLDNFGLKLEYDITIFEGSRIAFLEFALLEYWVQK